MKKNLLLSVTFFVVVSTLFIGCKSSENNEVDYTSIQAKEAALVERIRSHGEYYYWTSNDHLVQRFVDILDTEREAAMTYGFDSLLSCSFVTYSRFSDDSLVREFGCIEGSGACGTVFARLYRDDDKVRLYPGEERIDDFCCSTQDIFYVSKGRYLIVSYSCSGQDEFLHATIWDFNAVTPKFTSVGMSTFRAAEVGLDCDLYKWDSKSKTLWMPRSNGSVDCSWDGQYEEFIVR